MKGLSIKETNIPGLLVVDLAVHGDERGWFKENYQAEKMKAAGLPEWFTPIQNNISYNAEVGVTRGIHAEPWNKFISLATGKVFCAFVDFRSGEDFGKKVTITMTPEVAVFLPKGCGNSFQTLESNTAYTYLVDAHWSPEATYTMVNLADAQLAIDWPIPLREAVISEKDEQHPILSDVQPMEVT